MATYFARKSGNVNATDVWATTPGGTAGDFFPSFTSGDILVSNSFTITVNVSTNLGSTGEVRNGTFGGATAGGSFSLSNGVTLTANVVGSDAASTNLVTLAGSAAATIIGNINGGTSTNAVGVSHSSSGLLTVTGNLTGGSGNGAHAFSGTSGGISVTGSITSGSASPACGINLSGTGIITVVGNVNGSNAGGGFGHAGIFTQFNGGVNITGNITGGLINALFFHAATNAIITGNVSTTGAGTGIATGVSNVNITITGSVTAGNTTAAIGPANVSNIFTIIGRCKGGPLVSSPAAIIGTSSTVLTVDEIEYGDLGASPTATPTRLADKTTNVALLYRFGSTKKTLSDPASSGTLPATSDVRNGVVYAAGNRTGTLNIPLASQVLSGVAVDNTTGTALLNAATIQSACDAALSSFSSGRLSNCSTVLSVGQQLSNALDN